MNRRHFIQMGLASSALAASGCSVIGRELATQKLPAEIDLAASSAIPADPFWRLLNRAGYGPRPGDIAKAREMGVEQWLETQLHPDEIDDTPAELIISGLSVYNLDINSMLGYDSGDGYRDLIWATVARQIYSERQLYEAMVEFWSDHFTIYAKANQNIVFFKIADDRDVIRPNALGNFRDLLHASVRSPAMLIYLNNVRNFADHPNENYARELMELHTLGVFGGYDQEDVLNVARILSGLTVKRKGLRPWQTTFNNRHHDNDEKVVLDQTYPAGLGEQEISTLVDFLVDHPATADHIATKLVRRFIADDPPAELVAEVARVFRETNGEIRPMLRTIFLNLKFITAPPKLKRPVHYIVSAIRALNCSVRLSKGLHTHFQAMGQMPFMWPTPDGYPDVAEAWASNQLARWNFASAFSQNQINGVHFDLKELLELTEAESQGDRLDLFYTLLLGQLPADLERQKLLDFVLAGDKPGEKERRLHDVIGLMIAGPEFQLI